MFQAVVEGLVNRNSEGCSQFVADDDQVPLLEKKVDLDGLIFSTLSAWICPEEGTLLVRRSQRFKTESPPGSRPKGRWGNVNPQLTTSR